MSGSHIFSSSYKCEVPAQFSCIDIMNTFFGRAFNIVLRFCKYDNVILILLSRAFFKRFNCFKHHSYMQVLKNNIIKKLINQCLILPVKHYVFL